jgi:ABC-type multidrug transport system fused ATPase/permease subunit
VALVGHTGCGKTTLVQLIMRNYDVQAGAVLIDGIDVRELTLGSLRARFGVVLQKPVVFQGTVAGNIAYGRPEATRAEIEQAARVAELHELISAYPEGYDTRLGEHGVQLSVGEKQRLAIARAILRDPAILILDEATSALDSASEAAIQRALERVLRGRTSFVVAHRLSTIVRADLIVVMDRGAIVEQGRHEELMAREGGRYQQLYRALQGGGEPT